MRIRARIPVITMAVVTALVLVTSPCMAQFFGSGAIWQLPAFLNQPLQVPTTSLTNGDILVESGARRRFLPLRLDTAPINYSSFLGLAFAGEPNETVIDGITYKVEILRYIEKTELIGDDQMRRIRKFSDGTIETSVIDMRSNMIKETRTEKVKLTDVERLDIEKSPYKKTIFIKKE